MDLLRPQYNATHLAVIDEMRSRLNVAGAVLDGRIALGMTQAQVGQLAGTKQSRVSEVEAMKGNPRFDTLDRIARVLGLMIALVPREIVPAERALLPPGFQHVAAFSGPATIASSAASHHFTLPVAA